MEQDKREVRLTLTEDEYKTMMTALHDYGHYCLSAANDLSQNTKSYPYRGDTLEGARLARECGNRSFDLKGRVRKAYVWS